MTLNAHDQGAVPQVHSIPRRYVALGLVVVAIVLLGGLVLIRNHTMRNQPANAEIFSPAPPSVVQSVTKVPTSVVNAVGVNSPVSPTTPPTATNNSSLWLDSDDRGADLPVVFFYGAEFAPYAAAERWPLITALSRFGKFRQLGLMQSSGTVAFSNLSTFTFSHSSYSSIWLDLQTVERYGAQDLTGSGYTSLQKPTPRQVASVSVYDTSALNFPLLDIANHYTLVGSAFAPSLLAGLSQSQIATDLAYADSPITQAVITSANEITAAICTVTGQRPAAVCSTRGVDAADAKMGITTKG